MGEVIVEFGKYGLGGLAVGACLLGAAWIAREAARTRDEEVKWMRLSVTEQRTSFLGALKEVTSQCEGANANAVKAFAEALGMLRDRLAHLESQRPTKPH
jgi:hypothetical protein